MFIRPFAQLLGKSSNLLSVLLRCFDGENATKTGRTCEI